MLEMESCQRSVSSGGTLHWLLILAIAGAITLPHVVESASGPISVCTSLCTCTNQSFATVDCALADPTTVLDDRLLLPASATALHLRLISGGQLILRRDFFKANNVNHLSIDGSESRTGSSDTVVEFQEAALCNNHGQFPEILVTNVGRLVMHRNISCRAHLLNITHVKDVLLKTEFLSVDEAELFIQDVNNLQIEPNAFGGATSSRVQILRTTIESLPKLGASFRLLSFRECNISEIATHALDANEIEHVEFVACRLTSLRPRAVTDRLLCDTLIFRGCYIHRIEGQFVNGSGLNNLLLEDNTIDDIVAGAFTLTNINTLVAGNHIIRTGKEWLHLQRDWKNVTMAGNSFGEFNGIRLKGDGTRPDDGSVQCYFGNNTITNALPDSFTFGRTSCHIDAVHFGQECGCSNESWLRKLFGLPEKEPLPATITAGVSCQVEESLRYCFNRSEAPQNDTASSAGQVNVQYFLMEFCQKGGEKKCSSYTSGEEATNRKPPPPLIPLDKIGSLDDGSETGLFTVHMVPVAVAAFIILAVVMLMLTVCIYRRKRNETQQTMTMSTSASRQSTIRRSGTLHRSATFTPADRRIIANALGWIRKEYEQEIWSEINAPMQQLLAPNGGTIEEKVKVRLIGTILDSLKRHEISATQIVALNDILFRQLGPPAATTPELDVERPNSDNNDELGHIYDELQPNRARLLDRPAVHTHVGLLGDYASPLDNGTGGAATVVPEGIYSEPVLHDHRLLSQRTGDNRNLISPYAIGDATVQRNPNGREGGNLPDVIRPTGQAWKAPSEDDLDDEEEDEIDGEPERKTMLRPMDFGDAAGLGGSSNQPPTYAISLKQLKRPHRGNTPPPPLPTEIAPGEDQPDGSDGNRSEHSGSSMQTVRIEDMTIADDGDAR